MTKAEAIDNFRFFNEGDYITREMEESADIVLNLIQTQQEEIERKQREKEIHIKLEQQYKKEYLDARSEIQKKDKLINLILNTFIDEVELDRYYKVYENMAVEDLKEYFINKVEKEG